MDGIMLVCMGNTNIIVQLVLSLFVISKKNISLLYT
jgi:hypothetical protein